ncbi:eae-like domain protein [Enterobacter ludwigii]|uniref:eae-like domain protein n=1 Tax=Enterobacter ludwigii TaxID=299767 RepID=UPI0020C94501|nr:eae-like domain protein [Enterobacter ludwigii]
MTNVSAVEKMAELIQQMEENSPRVAALQYCLTQVAEKVEEAEKLNAELESRCAALAAENAGLKAVCEDRRTFIMNGVQLGYIQVPTVETDPALETIRVAVSPQEPTQATDAFLAEVRAQGVERLANAWYAIANETDPGISISDSSRLKYRQRADDAADFANEIRQEAAQ